MRATKKEKRRVARSRAKEEGIASTVQPFAHEAEASVPFNAGWCPLLFPPPISIQQTTNEYSKTETNAKQDTKTWFRIGISCFLLP